MSDLEFACVNCGICCQHIDRAKWNINLFDKYIQNEIRNFKYKHDDTGRCEMLGEDNKCNIYNNRPTLCNVKKLWEKYYKNTISLKDFYIKQNESCNMLMEDEGMMDDIIPGDVYDI